MLRKPLVYGVLASSAILAIYALTLTLVSGSSFAWEQFQEFWYYILALSLGFGIQVGLYSYLKAALRGGRPAGATLAVTGTTSTAAMISCCAHYLVNILPVLGATGIAAMAAAYQVELFFVGMIMNLGGIAFIGSRIYSHHKSNL